MQVRGRKRLLLYRPQALKALAPYPDWHILRRRCRVDPSNPDYRRFPAFQKVIPYNLLIYSHRAKDMLLQLQLLH